MANNEAYTLYTVTINGEVVFEGYDKAEAIRRWDADTHALTSLPEGGIGVQSFNDDHVMVRDGWILRVEGTRVYLNPNV